MPVFPAPGELEVQSSGNGFAHLRSMDLSINQY